MTTSYEGSKNPDTTSANHTNDEALRGFDFLTPVIAIGAIAASAAEKLPDSDEPHESYGFGD